MSMRNSLNRGAGVPPRIPRVIAMRMLLAACLWLLLTTTNAERVTGEAKNDKNEYVGSTSCAQCHGEIYRHYMQTSMGKSMSHITSSSLTPALLQSLSIPAHSFNEPTNRHFDTFVRNGKLYQREYQTAK